MADYKKSLVFNAQLDTSNVGPTIEQLKRQLNDVMATVNNPANQAQTANRLKQQGFGGLMSVPKPEEIQKSRRELDAFIREQAQQQEKLYKVIENQRDKMDKLQNIQKAMIKGSKEELAIEERKIAAKKELITLNDQYQRRNENINKALDTRAGMQPGMFQPGGAMGTLGSIGAAVAPGVGMAAAAAALAGTLIQQFKELPMQRAIATGTATQSAFGEPLQQMASGNIADLMAFMPERQAAMRQARDISRTKDMTDSMKAPLGILDAIGSVAGLSSGNLFNLEAGGVLGGVGAQGMSEQYLSAYRAQRNVEEFQNFQNLTRAAEETNPLKKMAAGYLQQNYMGDLASQRMLGMGDQSFYGAGGFRERIQNAGFRGDMGDAMAAQIMGAGGSTRGGGSLAALGLRAQRGFDLTNAGNVLGRISGAAGGGQASESIFRRVMEESVRAGLDKSEFREEQRKFADTTSEILSQVGVKNAEDAASVIQGFSRFLTNAPTMQEMAGAKSAYEEAQAFSAETGGRGGALQFASMLKNPVLKNLSVASQATLMQMPLKDLVPSSPFVQALASEAGVSPEEFIKQAKSGKQQSAYTAVGLDQVKAQKLNTYLSQRGLSGQLLNTAQMSQMESGTAEDREMLATYRQVLNAPTVRNSYQGIAKGTADVLGLIRGEQGVAAPEQYGERYEATMGTGAIRAGDKLIEAQSVVAQGMLENFREFKDSISIATQNLDLFTRTLMTAVSLSNAMPAAERPAFLRAAAERAYEVRARNQNQSSKPQR